MMLWTRYGRLSRNVNGSMRGRGHGPPRGNRRTRIMDIKTCCDRFYDLNITAIAEDRIAIDGVPATFCPCCGKRIEITVVSSCMGVSDRNEKVLCRGVREGGY